MNAVRRRALVTLDHRRPVSSGREALHTVRRRLLTGLVALNVILAVWYFSWLLNPAQGGAIWLYGLLVAAELFNLLQAAGFWWTVRAERPLPGSPAWSGPLPTIDVMIPTYNEPLDVVEPTVAAATRLRGFALTVHLLDDGNRVEMAALARRYGVRYITRTEHKGAKAGNLNHALEMTDGEFVAIFDCDHVPAPEFLEETLGHFANPAVAFVQTPQYYANRDSGPVAAAAATQQDLFFGVIARGKQAFGAVFCCGTNFVIRRGAIREVGGFPTNSLTEDFELSMTLHERGWESRYVPVVLARGLGPEDMASYVSQQARWAQGCLSALPRIFTHRLPLRIRAHYLLSASYFLSGWTVLLYMSLPILRIFFHVQPIRAGSADQFLMHFAPYFASCVLTLAVASDGRYSFSAYTLAAANFGVQIRAAFRVLLRQRGTFVVTPKHGREGRQIRPVAAALVAMGGLTASIAYALCVSRAPSALTNSAFASVHLVILGSGSWSALVRRRQPTTEIVDITEASVELAARPLEPDRSERGARV